MGDAVRSRTVFYIPGYDPRGPNHYHRLYREEAVKQSALNGLNLDVGPRRTIDEAEARWSVTSPNTQTDYRFLRYDDLMRKRWTRTAPGVVRDICYCFFALVWRGVTLKVAKLSWPFAVTLVNAFALLAGAVLLSLAAGLIAGAISYWWLGLIAGIAVFAGLLTLRPRLEQRIGSLWLARTFAFMADQGGGKASDMEARTDQFAERIAAHLSEHDDDEVLVIGHSSGAQIAVSALARALKHMGDAKVSLVTLGHTIPVLGLQPGAALFRAELQAVSHEPRVHWIDFTAAIDGACFPLSDPVVACGLPQKNAAHPSPKLLSTRFVKLFSPASYALLKRDFRRAHFQYLMATEIAGDYDFFEITGGDRTLASRYAHLSSVEGFNRFRLGQK